MAPPVPVYNQLEVRSQYRDQFNNKEKYECHLKSLTQHECTFKTYPDRSKAPEILCLPFKRVFQRCLVPTVIKEDGKKVTVKKWINIEITDVDSNRDLMENPKYSEVVSEFLHAERDFRKLMEQDMEGSL